MQRDCYISKVALYLHLHIFCFLQSVQNGFPGQVGQLPWSPEGRGQCDCGWVGQFRKVNTFEPLQTGGGKEPGHCTHSWIQRRKIQE